MAYAYIIHSKKLNRFYIGACQENIEARVEKHNTSFYGNNHFTSKAKDWVVFIEFSCDSYTHAIRLERKIKSMKSSIYIRNLEKYPELREKILGETKIT